MIKSKIIFIFLCSISFAYNPLEGKKVYICKKVYCDSTEILQEYVYQTFVDTFKYYFTPIHCQTARDSFLIAYHKNYIKKCFPLEFIVGCEIDYVVIVGYTNRIKFGLDDIKTLPVPRTIFQKKRGNVRVENKALFAELSIIDENPEYHYHTHITGTVYDVLTGKRIFVFSDYNECDADTANSIPCIQHNISEVVEDLPDFYTNKKDWKTYQKLNNIK